MHNKSSTVGSIQFFVLTSHYFLCCHSVWINTTHWKYSSYCKPHSSARPTWQPAGGAIKWNQTSPDPLGLLVTLNSTKLPRTTSNPENDVGIYGSFRSHQWQNNNLTPQSNNCVSFDCLCASRWCNNGLCTKLKVCLVGQRERERQEGVEQPQRTGFAWISHISIRREKRNLERHSSGWY